MNQVSMRITEHKYWNKINLGCNKQLKRRIVKNQTILFQADKTPRWFFMCQTPKQNSEVFCDHFRTLYGRQPHFDESVLEELPQHPIFIRCDHLPTEIIDATHKLKNKAPGKSGILTQLLKSLLDYREAPSMLKSIFIKF